MLSAITMIGVGGAAASPTADTLGQTTVQQRIVPNSDPDFRELALAGGEPYIVREDGIATAQAGRETRRTSLVYFGQLSDFQLADEESPARVEFVDPAGPPVDAAWRPWEAMEPQVDDAAIRQVNAFAAASPVADGSGGQAVMDFTIDTGDSADNMQLNETKWVRTLLEGGTLDPNSGVDPTGYVNPTCLPGVVPGAAEAARYTGVQDYSDYAEGAIPYFYDPDSPAGEMASFPAYPGLMDRAQHAFDAAGLDVPSYVAFGNHDGLVQGNQAANQSFEQVGTGCLKATGMVGNPQNYGDALATLDPATLLGLLSSDPTKLAFVPPDPKRQFVSKAQYEDVFLAGTQSDGHGFAYVDPAEKQAAAGAAGYYAWSPVPGIRFVSLDTLSEGGIAGPSADGNLDDPQYQWLQGQLDAATAADELVVIFSHHAIVSLTSNVPDEAAPACTANDPHGHDLNPGCDVDPRSSEPIHLGQDLTDLLHQYPNVIAWVAGHSHVNDVTPYPAPGGGGFWSIRVAAEADWPQQSRLLQVFDNHDGTLSIFGTILDHASDATAPAPGNASAFGVDQLASVARTLAYNDPQVGARECNPACGEGEATDRNVELLVPDPRDDPGGGGEPCLNRVAGSGKADRITGTEGPDRLLGRGGNDRLRGLGGDDCLGGGRGNDRLKGNKGDDLLKGSSGRDRLRGGAGTDDLIGGARRDRIKAADGIAETVRCGRGRDIAVVDAVDTPVDCEKTREQ